MRTHTDTVKIFLVAGIIAFASTVSAVHMHGIMTCNEHQAVALQPEHEITDCVFCWVVYQTLSAKASLPDIFLSSPESDIADQSEQPVKHVKSHVYGRAPPLSA